MSTPPNETQVYEYVKKHPNVTSKDIATHFGVAPSTINQSRTDGYPGIYKMTGIVSVNYRHSVLETTTQCQRCVDLASEVEQLQDSIDTLSLRESSHVCHNCSELAIAIAVRDKTIDDLTQKITLLESRLSILAPKPTPRPRKHTSSEDN